MVEETALIKESALMNKSSNPSFVETFFGVVFEPSAATSLLLAKQVPPHLIKTIFLFLLSLILPGALYLSQNDHQFTNQLAVLAVSVSLIFMFFFFFILEAILFALTRIPGNLIQVLALACYCLIPITFAIWLVYIFNFFSDGSLTVVQYIVTGSAPLGEQFFRAMPFVALIVLLNIFLLIYYAVKTLGKTGFFNALIISLMSLVPIYFSFLFGVFMGELFHRGTIDIFQGLLWKFNFEALLELLSSSPPTVQ